MFFGDLDFSEKVEGQSTEILPKTAGAVERLSAFVKLGLTSFGDWYTVSMPANSPIPAHIVNKLLNMLLTHVWGSDRKYHKFPVIVADAIKQAMMESLVVFKIHALPITRSGLDPQTMTVQEVEQTALATELLPTEAYLPDPTGRGLYEIHESVKDLYDVKRLAKLGIYDVDAVNSIEDAWSDENYLSFDREDERRKPRERGQNDETAPSFRKKVLIGELWGTLLDDEGDVIATNCLTTVANRKVVIRKPQINPLWHGDSPFVVGPLLRVPHSVWHRALLDDATRLNKALIELFNLGLDGAIAAVWGVRQVHENFVKDPQRLSGGIPQNATIVVTDDCPPGMSVVKQVATGEVPGEFMPMLELLGNEFNDAAITNDLKLGQMTEQGGKTATEISEVSQSYSTILDSLIADLENEVMSPLLKKVWLTFLQHFNDFPAEGIVGAIGEEDAVVLSQLPPDIRFKLLGGAGFEVHGLSAVVARARTLQKLLALLDTVGKAPWLLQSFLKRFSPNKLIDMFMKHANIDSKELEADQEEIQQNMQQMAPTEPGPQVMSPQGPQGPTGPPMQEPAVSQPGGMM
jgi:hypothetical protein